MASTFDIRFARSEGFAALWEAPANSLRWKGAGKLSVDAQGISIAARRGLLSLFRRHGRRIAAEQLSEVYRAGDAIRIEYHSGATRSVMPLWARDAETAARIVKLLPTSRTVELEEVADAHRYRLDWRPLALLLAVVIVVTVGFIWRQHLDVAEVATPAAEVPPQIQPGVEAKIATATAGDVETGRADRAASQPPARVLRDAAQTPRAVVDSTQVVNTQAAPSAPASGEREVVTGTPGSSSAYLPAETIPFEELVHGSASSQMWELFDRQSGADPDSWWQFTVSLHTTPQFQHPDLWAMRENMLAISRAWRADDADMARRLTESLRRNF